MNIKRIDKDVEDKLTRIEYDLKARLFINKIAQMVIKRYNFIAFLRGLFIGLGIALLFYLVRR